VDRLYREEEKAMILGTRLISFDWAIASAPPICNLDFHETAAPKKSVRDMVLFLKIIQNCNNLRLTNRKTASP
jgi:hypothetical protein